MQPILLFLYLSIFAPAPDSIGTKVAEGHKMIIHRVEPRETWYSVSRKYGVPLPTLQKANPTVLSLQIGQNIDVPANKQLVRTSTVLGAQVTKSAPVVSTPVQRTVPIQNTPVERQTPATSGGKTHTVNAGETMFSIARKYGITVANIKSWNNLGAETVKIGEVLNVSPVAGSYSEPIVRNDPNRPMTPAEKERLKKIADKHVVSSDPWERMEHLADGVSEGRPPARDTSKHKGIVGGPVKKDTSRVKGVIVPGGKPLPVSGGNPVSYTQGKPVGTNTAVKKDSSRIFRDKGEVVPAAVPTSVLMKTKKDSLSQSNRALKETSERGAASWINDEQVNATKFYALHRTAPIGTIIKVTNITNSQSVFVKVVGILPDTGDNSNLIIKISKAAAKKLNTTDAKFQAELSYGVAQ